MVGLNDTQCPAYIFCDTADIILRCPVTFMSFNNSNYISSLVILYTTFNLPINRLTLGMIIGSLLFLNRPTNYNSGIPVLPPF